MYRKTFLNLAIKLLKIISINNFMSIIIYKFEKDKEIKKEKYDNIKDFLDIDLFKDLQARERNLLIQFDLFDNVNTFIKRNKLMVLKLRDIRSIYTINEIFFIFNGFFQNIKPDIINFESNNYIGKYNDNYILSGIEFVLNYIVYEGNIFIENYMKELHLKIHRKNLNEINIQEIYVLQNKVNNYIEHYSDIQELLEEIVTSEKDLIRLEELCGNKEEIELVFDNYINLIKDIINEYKNINNQIKNFKDLTELQLANFRNKLALVSVHINIFTLFFAVAAFITGAFGMNLSNGLEDKQNGMYIIFGILNCFIAIAISSYIIFYKKFYRNSHILNLSI